MKANKSANCFFLLSIAALAYQISRLRFWKWNRDIPNLKPTL
jgi:hypothetical protein